MVQVLSLHENEGWNKRVESTGRPCLDEGSIPSSSTIVLPSEDFTLVRVFCFVTLLTDLLSFCYYCTHRKVPKNGTKRASFGNSACGNVQHHTRCLQSSHATFEIIPCCVCGILTPKCVQKQAKSTCFVRRTLQNGTLE